MKFAICFLLLCGSALGQSWVSREVLIKTETYRAKEKTRISGFEVRAFVEESKGPFRKRSIEFKRLPAK